MSHLTKTVVRAIGLSLLCVSMALAIAPPPERGHGVVATDHPLASAAGARLLAMGGNAVDAMVGAALSAGVVQPAGSGIGGGGFALVAIPGQPSSVLDFREVAPAGATRDMFLDSAGVPVPKASTVGGLAIGVPGESRGLALLHSKYGKLSKKQVAQPAIEQAKRGFAVGDHLASALGRTDYASVKQIFTLPGGRVASRGDWVKRPALARTLARWAASEGEDLHVGAGAQDLVLAAAQAGAVLKSSDLAAYQPLERQPLVGHFRGYTIETMPPPSSGGLILLTVLGALEDRDLNAMGHNSSAYIHVVSEAFQHGFADRARVMGDPAFYDVPVERLLAPGRIAEVRASYDPDHTLALEAYGTPMQSPEDAGTHHLSVMDATGMAVSMTTTINTTFGSGVVASETGVILNNEMDDFSVAPGVPNAYGLIGSEANAVAPGKRPLSSMTPTIVRNAEGEVVLVVGCSGGSFIISATTQALLNVLVFDMDAQEAVSAPRFHHQWQPHMLMLEPGFPKDVQAGLEARGHQLRLLDHAFTGVQAVVREGPDARAADDRDVLAGGSDPRKGGRPVAVP